MTVHRCPGGRRATATTTSSGRPQGARPRRHGGAPSV